MLNVVRFWILLSTLLAGGGWVLSAVHQLNRPGYGVLFAIAGVALFFWRRKNPASAGKGPAQVARKFCRRFKRPAPLIFLALAILAMVAGALYVHSNGDTNAYRTPRVLHWLGQEQWHWIRTADPRMNIVDCGFEWLTAPLILFTRTDRFIFLINAVSYLMLPGLIFSVFTRLGLRPRVAWWWMWLLASGWCFVLQAGSDDNDSFATIYALAAVDLALRAREKKCVTDWWLALLAAGLLTGAKQTDIPLAFLWLVAAWPGLRLALARPLATAVVAVLSLLVSALPVTISNLEHSGNWQGLATGTAKSIWSAGSPVWKIIGNFFYVPLQNLLPPFFPWSGAWDGMMSRFLQTPLGGHFVPFERFGHLNAGISEACAGIGLGICVLTVISLLGARCIRQATPDAAGSNPGRPLFRWLRVMPWLLTFLYMAEICSFANARFLSPYYPLLFPLLLCQPGQAGLVRRWWWRCCGILVMLLAVLLLVVSRDRPLFPALTLIGRLQASHPESKFISRLWLSYAWPKSVERQRNFFTKDLPPDERVIGYATGNGASEPGLWLPFGQRRVERVLADDTPEQLRSRGIHLVLVEDLALDRNQMTIEQWLQHYDASLMDQLAFLENPYRPPGHLYLARLRSPPAPAN